MPVLPEVGSRIVCPGWIAPSASAASIIALATRSLTEPVGLRPSSFAKMRTSGFGESRGSSTSGVLPTASIRLPYRPPHGRLSVGSSIAIESVVRSRGRDDSQNLSLSQVLNRLLESGPPLHEDAWSLG